MRKRIMPGFLSGVLMSVLTLAACSYTVESESTAMTQPDNLRQESTSQEQPSPEPLTGESDVLPDQSEFEHICYRDTLSDNVASEEGLYLIRCLDGLSANLFYVDVQSGQEVFLCNQPNCTHDSEACLSYVAIPDGLSIPGLAYYKDSLFLVKTAGNEYGNACIVRMNKDGSERKTICELQSNQTIGSYAFGYNNCLVLDVMDTNSDGGATEALTLVDVDTGEVSKLIELPQNDNSIHIRPMSCWKNNIVFAGSRPDGTVTLFLFEPGVDTFDDVEAVLEKNYLTLFEQVGGNAYVRDGYLCEVNRNSSVISRTNLETGEKLSYSFADKSGSTAGIAYLFDGNIALTYLDENSQQQYFVNFDNNELVKLNFTNSYTNDNYVLLGEYGDKLLFKTGYREVSTYREGLGAIPGVYVEEMRIINKNDYIADVHNEIIVDSAM